MKLSLELFYSQQILVCQHDYSSMLLCYASFRMAIRGLKICVSNLLAILQPTMLGAVVTWFQMKIWPVLSRFKCMSWTAVDVQSQSNVWLALSSYQSARISVSKHASCRIVKVWHTCLKYRLIYWTKGKGALISCMCKILFWTVWQKWRYFLQDNLCKILFTDDRRGCLSNTSGGLFLEWSSQLHVATLIAGRWQRLVRIADNMTD